MLKRVATMFNPKRPPVAVDISSLLCSRSQEQRLASSRLSHRYGARARSTRSLKISPANRTVDWC